MKAALALLAAASLVHAQPAPPTPPAHAPDQAACGNTIEKVREERGLPRLDRDTATSREPLLIAAVDRRIEGCSVLVMRSNINDVRPVPANPGAPAELLPARQSSR
jgi:hypothetical protein